MSILRSQKRDRMEKTGDVHLFLHWLTQQVFNKLLCVLDIVLGSVGFVVNKD